MYVAGAAQGLLGQLQCDDVGVVGVHSHGGVLAAGGEDLVIPAEVVGPLAPVLHGVHRTFRGLVRGAAVVEGHADEAALRVRLHHRDDRRRALGLEVHFKDLHCLDLI